MLLLVDSTFNDVHGLCGCGMRCVHAAKAVLRAISALAPQTGELNAFIAQAWPWYLYYVGSKPRGTRQRPSAIRLGGFWPGGQT